MNYNVTSLIIGTGTLLLLGYVLLTAISFGFLKLNRKKEKLSQMTVWLNPLWLTLGWIAVSVLAIWTASTYGNLVFGVAAFVLIAVPAYLVAWKLYGFNIWYRLAYALTMGIIMNPVWFVVLGALR